MWLLLTQPLLLFYHGKTKESTITMEHILSAAFVNDATEDSSGKPDCVGDFGRGEIHF